MPCLEEKPKDVKAIIIKATASNEEQEQRHAHQEEAPVVRELTQTDRLNNQLLKSFLSRLNSGDGAVEKFVAGNQTQTSTITEDEDDRSADFED